jgi:hypothetical protein
MKLQTMLVFGVFLVVSLLLSAMLWHWQMAGSYFVCQEHGIILDFLPPFIHPGVSGDVYLQPRHVVYTIWSVYLAVAVVVPALCAWLFARLYERDLKKEWM